MNLRESDIVLLENLGQKLARPVSMEGVAQALHATMSRIAGCVEVRIVGAHKSSGWREWISGEKLSTVRSHKEFPQPAVRGTAVSFNDEAPEEGFVWVSGQNPRGAIALRLITSHIATAAALVTALGRARRAAAHERELARERFRSRDDERRRIAQELHDDLGQSLASLRVSLKWVEDRLRGRQDMEEPVAELAAAREATAAILSKVRDLSHTLYPSILETLGLTPALKELVHQATRRSRIAAQCESVGKERPIPREVAEGLYRCCQEAISNVMRHASASRIAIMISYSADAIRLTVEDNGEGFEPGRLHDSESPLMSSGFWTIRQRVAGLGGAFRVSTALGKGVTVEIVIPLKMRSRNAGIKDKTVHR